MNQTLYYRWMVSYFCCHSFMDKNILGLRGSNLRMSHELTYCIYRYVAENLVILAKGDRRNGNSEELNSKLVLIDEMTMAQIMAGFPTLYGIPHQLLPVFLVSEIDQLTCIPYIDAVESFGLPADTCPVPTSECGALVIDALPHLGSCYISSSMPCDGSVMASSYFSRRFPDIPVHHLCFPVRYEDELTLDAAVEDVKECIRFIEKQTGEKWNWDSYFTAMKRFNTETDYELQKWEINKTAYPQLIGPSYELFRKWCYEMDGGLDPRTIKSCEKVNKILLKGYKNKEQAWHNKMRYRAITWSCPPHYYANFSNWLANSWGINVVVEMESLNFTKHLNTSDETGAARHGSSVRAHGHAPPHQRWLPQRRHRAVASVRGLEHGHRHHVAARRVQEHGYRSGSARRAGPRAGSASDLDPARSDGSAYCFAPHHARHGLELYGHRHARHAGRRDAARLRRRCLHVIIY